MQGSPEHPADVELLKAVAQAWHAQSSNPRPSPPSDAAAGARRGRGRRPSRFKLEAAAVAAAARGRRRSWDFAQSLWDTYELVTVAQKLESSLVLDPTVPPPPPPPAAGGEDGGRGGAKRARESNRSLKSLILRSTSRRFKQL